MKPEDLYTQAEKFSKQANDLFAQCDLLREQAQQIKAQYQPRIDDVRAKADTLAEQFKKLYRESQDAYNVRAGALAKELANKAQSKQKECQSLNEKVGSLLAEMKLRIDPLYRQIDKKKQEANSCIQEAKHLRAQAKQRGKPELRHSPFTSEPSKPHPSKAEPREHVDIYHYGENGIEDKSLTIRHIVDKIAIRFGWKVDSQRKKKGK